MPKFITFIIMHLSHQISPYLKSSSQQSCVSAINVKRLKVFQSLTMTFHVCSIRISFQSMKTCSEFIWKSGTRTWLSRMKSTTIMCIQSSRMNREPYRKRYCFWEGLKQIKSNKLFHIIFDWNYLRSILTIDSICRYPHCYYSRLCVMLFFKAFDKFLTI